MMKPVAFSAVARWLVNAGFVENLEVSPADDFLLEGFASLERAGASDVTFWLGRGAKNETNANGFSESLLLQIHAGVLFAPSSETLDARALPGVRRWIPVENPYHVMVEFLNHFAIEPAGDACIAPTAKIHESAVVEGSVGEDATIGPNCVVMRGARVGDRCILEANVTVYPNVEIGPDCIFQAGAVIGSRGFGFYEFEGRRRMVPHLAGVRIGRACSFGANTVVAAGFVSPTTIGENCHFDSFVQIAHNCVLGNRIFMASQSGIAGTVTVEDDVEFAGGAQSAGHLTIGNGSRVAAKAGVTKNVPAGRTVAGFPAEDIESWRRSVVRLRMLGRK